MSPTEPALPVDAPFVPMDALIIGHQFPSRWERRDGRTGIRARANDLLFARITPSLENGKVSRVPYDWPRIGGSTELLVVRPGQGVEPEYLYYWSLSPAVRAMAAARMTGTTGRMRLSKTDLAAIPIRLPDRNEQRRITDILEDHFSRLDAASRYIEAAHLRANVLVESILHSRLANDVEMKRLAWLLETPLKNGRSVPSADLGFPVLRLTALNGPKLDLTQSKIGAWSREQAQPYLVETGDIFVSRGNGSLNLVARGSIAPKVDAPVAFPDTMVRIRLQRSLVPEYFMAVWNSKVVRRQIERSARTAAGIYKVNQRQLEAIEVPVLSTDAQVELAGLLAGASEDSELVKRELSSARRRSAGLRRALLHAAFTGQLTGSASDLDRAEELAEAM